MRRYRQAGFSTVVIILILAALVLLAQLFSESLPEFSVKDIGDSDTTSNPSASEGVETITLLPQHGLAASGKASRSYEPGEFNLSFSGALPALEDDGYYEAYLSGPSEILLGEVKKAGPVYKIDYVSALDLRGYQKLIIRVDGPRDLANQPIPLPFDILIGEFRN